jgi:hypothetical protein
MDVEDDDADGSADAAPANGVSDLDVRSKNKRSAQQIRVALHQTSNVPSHFPSHESLSQIIIQQWLRSKQTSDPDAQGEESSKKASAAAAATDDGDDDEEDDGPVDENDLGYAERAGVL